MFKIVCAVVGLFISEANAFEGENALGPGIHIDRYGRPVTFEDSSGDRVQGDVQIDSFGPGVSADESGRAVRARPLFDDGEVLPGDIGTGAPRRGFTPLDR